MMRLQYKGKHSCLRSGASNREQSVGSDSHFARQAASTAFCVRESDCTGETERVV